MILALPRGGRFGREHALSADIRIALECFDERRRRVIRGNDAKCFAIPSVDIPKCSTADADRVLQHGRKDRLKIAG